VKWKASNSPTFGTGHHASSTPLTFITAAGITSHERRSHLTHALHVPPHRRTR
jgi:hypothetical protein